MQLEHKSRIIFGYITLLLLISSLVQAETIVLVGGDTMFGEITKATDSSVTFVHNVLGGLEIPKEKIANVIVIHNVLGELAANLTPTNSKPDTETMVLAGGDTMYGTITVKKDSTITFVHEVLGKLEIAEEQIASVTFVHGVLGPVAVYPNNKVSPAIEGQAGQKPKQEAESSKPELNVEAAENIWFEPTFDGLNATASRLQKKKWSLAMNLSLDTSSGQTDEATFRFGTHLKRALPRERQSMDLSYYNKESRGDTTDNKLTVGFIHDWLNPGSRWFFFTAGRFDYDEFESWERRSNAQTGMGYNLIKADNALLDFRLGAGGRKESGSKNDNLKFEGLTGLDLDWKITKRQSLDASIWFFPILTDSSDYRTRTSLNWRYRMSEELNMSLMLGLLHEYQSITDPDTSGDDTRVYTGIQVEF